MFTGIIEGTGRLLRKRAIGGGIAFDLEAGFALDDPQEGESIAINGVCLTAYNISGRHFSADVSPETLSRTQLGRLSSGDLVNMERALRLSDRLGGHLVSGHVDCVAVVSSRKPFGDYTIFTFSLPKAQSRYIVEKGSVAVDGISLTVNSCAADQFSVSIIPHTVKMTTLNSLQVGHHVNIEVDIIGKYVEKLLGAHIQSSAIDGGGNGIDAAFLAEHGFFR
ncbi:riboflavin synthase [Desulfoprunum benzoelyticum]|uniref:Riboflavin synthase n=1 Tax=Desulfoprunum benzoelyticum TaxID=1506996 RepID=A0A840UVX0_9BACT|nr:riboflavin synthase [Desulfoprunum benzoelyticum]MBB5348986.1 riboflavin synthase [Desulfoprunum benzoelyticum]MBM9528852.1 riboflavin synthase [Desulfoprunum benzoelyticum]